MEEALENQSERLTPTDKNRLDPDAVRRVCTASTSTRGRDLKRSRRDLDNGVSGEGNHHETIAMIHWRLQVYVTRFLSRQRAVYLSC